MEYPSRWAAAGKFPGSVEGWLQAIPSMIHVHDTYVKQVYTVSSIVHNVIKIGVVLVVIEILMS